MKVDFLSGIGPYKKNTVVPAAKGSQPDAAVRTDVAEFSHGAIPVPDKAPQGAKSAILSSVNAPAEATRLEALRQSVRDGSYSVPSEKLADAILGLYR